MRLGVIADIHGNVRALEAVLTRLQDLTPDHIVNLGDCVSGPLWPSETVRLLRGQSNMSHVRGNHDRVLRSSSPDTLGSWDSFAWKELDANSRNWVATLPSQVSVGGARCFHASPDCDEQYLMEEVREGRLVPAAVATIDARLDQLRERLVLCGHSHLPRMACLPSGTVVVNPGSVGCPAYFDPGDPAHRSESGSPHARFAIVTIAAQITVEHHAIPYDWEDAARRAEAHGRIEWSRAIRTGTMPSD